MELFLVIALLTLTGCSALVCSPWDPRCEVNKECKTECIKCTCSKTATHEEKNNGQ